MRLFYVSDDTKSLWLHMWESRRLNPFGKILMTPVILLVMAIWAVLDTLCMERPNEPSDRW